MPHEIKFSQQFFEISVDDDRMNWAGNIIARKQKFLPPDICTSYTFREKNSRSGLLYEIDQVFVDSKQNTILSGIVWFVLSVSFVNIADAISK